MKLIVSPSEMQEIDRKTIHERGVAGHLLMERAGRAVYEEIASRFSSLGSESVCVISGKGNNGGDGFVLASLLAQHNVPTRVFFAGKRDDLKTDLLVHFNNMLTAGLTPFFLEEVPEKSHDVARDSTIVVDALLGTGSKRPLAGIYTEIVNSINAARQKGAFVISVDIPSGLDGETGLPSPIAVCADLTVTMGLPKKGLIIGDGKSFAGEVVVADLGFPDDLTMEGTRWLIDAQDVRKNIPPRKHSAHKYSFGKVLLIAGSRGMSGAALLAGRAALRSGCGLLKVAVPNSIAHVIEMGLPEAMTVRMAETGDGSLAGACVDGLEELCSWADSIAMGPGLSRDPETTGLTQQLMKRIKKPVVIDADALNHLKAKLEILRDYPAEAICTPHLGELAVLTGTEKDRILNDIEGTISSFSKSTGVVLLLKGSPTRIACPDGKVYFVNKGNPGMATAGSGDVLTGMIAGLLGQGLAIETATYCAAFLHGIAGDAARNRMTEAAMIAGDIIDHLPDAYKHILSGRERE